MSRRTVRNVMAGASLAMTARRQTSGSQRRNNASAFFPAIRFA
jgi:hypothetical protein